MNPEENPNQETLTPAVPEVPAGFPPVPGTPESAAQGLEPATQGNALGSVSGTPAPAETTPTGSGAEGNGQVSDAPTVPSASDAAASGETPAPLSELPAPDTRPSIEDVEQPLDQVDPLAPIPAPNGEAIAHGQAVATPLTLCSLCIYREPDGRLSVVDEEKQTFFENGRDLHAHVISYVNSRVDQSYQK